VKEEQEDRDTLLKISCVLTYIYIFYFIFKFVKEEQEDRDTLLKILCVLTYINFF
jgi:hypothetical protein